MTVSIIQAGTQHNVVPDSCKFTVDIRLNECYTHQEVFDIIQENIKFLHDNKINAFFQKENIKIFDESGNESVVFPVLIACLGLVSQVERENIKFRLAQSSG